MNSTQQPPQTCDTKVPLDSAVQCVVKINKQIYNSQAFLLGGILTTPEKGMLGSVL